VRPKAALRGAGGAARGAAAEGRSTAASEQTRTASRRTATDSHAEKSGRSAGVEAPARPEPQHRCEPVDLRDVEGVSLSRIGALDPASGSQPPAWIPWNANANPLQFNQLTFQKSLQDKTFVKWHYSPSKSKT